MLSTRVVGSQLRQLLAEAWQVRQEYEQAEQVWTPESYNPSSQGQVLPLIVLVAGQVRQLAADMSQVEQV